MFPMNHLNIMQKGWILNSNEKAVMKEFMYIVYMYIIKYISIQRIVVVAF